MAKTNAFTSKLQSWCVQNSSSLLIIISAILGLLCGLLVKNIWTLSSLSLTYIAIPGKLVIRSFSMILVPLVVTSLSTSIASLRPDENKRIISITIGLFMTLSSYAAIFGSLMVCMLKPGVNSDASIVSSGDSELEISAISPTIIRASQEEALHDLFINMIPDNIITATFMQQYTGLVAINASDLSLGYRKATQTSFSANLLGLCVFSLILGFAIKSLNGRVDGIKRLLEETNYIVMELLKALLRVMPIGMFCWMFVESVRMQSPDKVIAQIALFFATVFIAFGIHLFLVLPGVYLLFLRKNPYKFYANIVPAIIISFGSASSAVTLPVTIKCMEDRNQLDRRVSRFVLPLGMTIHMNGFAMYYPMVTLFVAQMLDQPIGIQQLVILCLFSVLMSIAAPAMPSGGSAIVKFVAFCSVIGISNPLNILAYTMTLDWLMSRIRTSTNIIGDCFVAAIVQKLCSNSLPTIVSDDVELEDKIEADPSQS